MRELVLGQVKINENINKKLLANDKSLESLNVKLETLSSTLKNQLSFNKMIETQLAQIAAALPIVESGKIPGQPEPPVENVSMVSTGRGNSSLGHHAITMQAGTLHQGTTSGMAWWQQCKRIQGSP